MLNALAAAALGRAAGAEPAAILAGLSSFAGLRRRLEVLGTVGRDHAGGRLCPSPHGGGRHLGRACGGCFPAAGCGACFNPTRPREPARLLRRTGRQPAKCRHAWWWRRFSVLAKALPPGGGDGRRPGPRRSGPGGAETLDVHAERRNRPACSQTHLHAGDVLVTMGAGDIGRMAYGFLERFREDRAAG